MNKELLEKYKYMLEDDTLFNDDVRILKFYDPLYQTVGMGHFKELYKPSDVKWGNRIIVDDYMGIPGSYVEIKGIKYHKLYSVKAVSNQTGNITYGLSPKDQYSTSQTFQRCYQLIRTENRTAIKDL